ncbi:TRAP transporter large permease [Halococcus thailandensis]|uniref:TRAP C4-dicarboxylate transport system permease DctM subunit n=1 Tax=Halococcus thailandensis JCM 13552 TaxID=1227457 RepID=M0NIR0_9EURY|nr:TRAP transporter large permease [Halococcus thailandensis]EMA56545.1 TRAP C4-dicarboxylate transport system permease DctM subunit [Halococcus thailandensis JCM 13552]
MAATTLLIVLTLICIGLFATGIPVFLAFGAWGVGFSVIVGGFPLVNTSVVAYEQLNTFSFVAIPLFILLGSFINEFRISNEIIKWARSWGGWLPGSTANTAIYTSGVFAAITGSNAATTAAVGEALTDDLEEEGYDPEFAAASIASGGTLGIIIPPSVLFIIYGITFSVSVSDLFLAGVIPGIMMMVGLSLTSSYISHKRGYGTVEYSFQLSNIARATWEAKLAIGAIVVLLGGIYAGLYTPSESAAVAFLYIILVGLITRRLTNPKQLLASFENAIILIGMIIPVFVTAVMVQQGLSFIGLQDVLASAVISLQHPWLIGAVMIVIMLISGSVLSSVPNMILVAPLLAPAATQLGISPIMWGVIFMIGDAIGFITPPYGLNLFIISGLTGIEYTDVARAALPYLGVLLLIWVAFFAFPELNFLAPV